MLDVVPWSPVRKVEDRKQNLGSIRQLAEKVHHMLLLTRMGRVFLFQGSRCNVPQLRQTGSAIAVGVLAACNAVQQSYCVWQAELTFIRNC